MARKLYTNLIFTFLVFLFAVNICTAALVDTGQTGGMKNQSGLFADKAGFSVNTSVGSIVATVIQVFLGLLGIIFIILILIAGYNWMTAAGDEEKVRKAKETLSRAIIGLIIIIAAYSITYFVFNNLGWSGSTPNNTGTSQ